jgi:hypothetical protein
VLAQIAVAWTATCGTVVATSDTTARYTAPTRGPCTVTATAGGKSGQATVNVVGASVVAGIPFGPFSGFDGTAWEANLAPFTLTQDSYQPENLLARIAAARKAGRSLMLALTGGSHELYLTNGTFDPAKWAARLQTFNSGELRNAVASAVADGVIVGGVVMDEPNVSGLGDGNSWGVPGTMTKARVDSLCMLQKAVFPTLPAGVQHIWTWEQTKGYKVCDFLNTQWGDRQGAPVAFRDAAVAMATRDGHALILAFNLLNGGPQDKDGVWDCTGPGQAGTGTFSPNCRMAAATITAVGQLFAGSGICALVTWRYDGAAMSRADNQAAFTAVRDSAGRVPRKACRRT